MAIRNVRRPMWCGDAQAKFVTIDKSQRQSIRMRRVMRRVYCVFVCAECWVSFVLQSQNVFVNTNSSWRWMVDHRLLRRTKRWWICYQRLLACPHPSLHSIFLIFREHFFPRLVYGTESMARPHRRWLSTQISFFLHYFFSMPKWNP